MDKVVLVVLFGFKRNFSLGGLAAVPWFRSEIDDWVDSWLSFNVVSFGPKPEAGP
jgi:hypothetical protein